MDILFVASEIAPMVKVTGLADVVASLSKALRLLGHKVTLALPRYPGIEASGVMIARRLTPLVLTMGGERVEVTVFDGRLGSGVELVLFDVPGLFSEGPSRLADEDEGDLAAARRYGVFALSVVELVRQRALAGTPFEVVHAHDWPAALVPYLLRDREGDARPASVLTLHDLARQGLFPRDALRVIGLGDEHFQPSRLEFYGKVSFLKAGLLAADAITTVSPTYAREILTPDHGERLDGVLATRAKENEIVGIVNGIDYAVYNPMTDPALPARYDAEDTTNKARCKSALLAELGLPIDIERPLVVSVGRISTQKGGDLLATALPKLLKSDATVVVAGAGDRAIVTKLEAAIGKAPERARLLGDAAEPLVHRLFAAADIVLVPSRYEPCGLVQLYAQRYGALPVAYRTGGLLDTIVDCDAALETGTGFLYDKPTSTHLVGAVQRALAAMASPRWPALRRRVMRLDLGWDRPARRYVHVYRSAMSKRVA
ncbi:glycogen synthase [Polyangium sorediatum]|uniref:Glycogen synthase n=1 Tax=Polyangium sorediatum TaxID=889274 RepID=A0ABT6NYV4_9BACT|nr:glycogen/starch synthase [Polyangium sorediatum]MDI1433530.1 glycogen/starch synthase [Polyangium sorediatum]